MAENWPGPRVSTWRTPSVALWVFFFFLGGGSLKTDFGAQLNLGQFAIVICIDLFLTRQL